MSADAGEDQDGEYGRVALHWVEGEEGAAGEGGKEKINRLMCDEAGLKGC